jgi:ribosome-associated protein
MSENQSEMDHVQQLVCEALDEIKAEDPVTLDVRGRTPITDVMIVATGTSRRHVQSIAEHVREQARAGGIQPAGMEGATEGDWVLVDLGAAVLHVMLAEVRDFYRLENIWGVEDWDEDPVSDRA